MRSNSPVFESPSSSVLRSDERKLSMSAAGKGGRRISSMAWTTPFVANYHLLAEVHKRIRTRVTHNVRFYYVGEEIEGKPIPAKLSAKPGRI